VTRGDLQHRTMRVTNDWLAWIACELAVIVVLLAILIVVVR
jgi:uncharacterized membrane protein YcjF (UPF0283 family)